ncbi:claspin [Chanodichthys erythropterus]|uniref:claspin n=1 Tax=Chanodichthys erythropterus TaxID=933992 RepID=UPI00351F1B20
MDAPESSNRFGRTIWTVWGYLSGAVARYLRPEVTDEGNQSVLSRLDDVDLKSTGNKINREVKANNSENEDKNDNQNDKSTADVKCSPPEYRVQVASVPWENTDVVKDDKNDQLQVVTTRKQAYYCAVWSAATDHGERVSGDSESEGRKSGDVEEEAVSSFEGQANANSECKENETENKREQKHGDNEECDQKRENEKCSKKREDPDNADVTVQSEIYGQDVEQEKEINMMDHGETECIGGFKHADECRFDEKDQEKNEDQRIQSQVQDLLPELECSSEETDRLSKPKDLKEMEKYFDEIAELSKNEVEEMIPGARGGTESEQDMTKSGLLESVKTLQRVSEEISEKNVSDNETELKMTSVLDEFFETVNTSEDTLQLDSKQDTPENTSETGTGLPVVDIKPDGMFSDLIVCEFPGELRRGPETALAEPALGCSEEIKTNLREPQSLAEEQTERETFVARSVEHPETQKAVEEAVEIEQDIETPIESLGATESQTHPEIDKTKFPLKEHVELRTEPIDETTETNISSEDEEAEPFETQSQSSNTKNVTFQTHELLEFTERECKSSQETMDTFSESLGNSGVSEIAGTAEIEHVAEDQTDAKPVLTRTLSPAEFLEETLDLQGESEQCIEKQETLDADVSKTALEYVEEVMNQVLKEMIETENNLIQETETLAGLSAEDLGDAEYQGPEECVSVGAFVLEEERKLLGETMGSMVEMDLETAIREVAKQNKQHISSPECETTEADGHHEQETYLCAGTDHEGNMSCDSESKGYKVENEAISSDEGQAERVDANSECKESETAQELDETVQIEQIVDNDEECDPNHEDEKCAMKREGPDNTDVQSELYAQDVEQEMVTHMMDNGETESIGGFKLADEHEKEKNIVDQNDHEKTENDEDQGPELQVPADAFVLEEERKLLGETMDSKIELEVENTSSEVVKQHEQESSPECETTEADGRHEQIQKVIAAETVLSSHEELMEISRLAMKRGFDQVSKELPEVKTEEKSDLDLQAFEDSSLDFTIQKSRIAVKNPLVRPPKDPRRLIYKISVEPLLLQPPPCAPRAEVSVPSKGVIGFKLPGLGAGLPVLRKTEFGKKAREGGEEERTLHPQLKSVAVTEDSVKQEQASAAKPKWTPPKHPGLGGPLMMAELKSKLRKPVKE